MIFGQIGNLQSSYVNTLSVINGPLGRVTSKTKIVDRLVRDWYIGIFRDVKTIVFMLRCEPVLSWYYITETLLYTINKINKLRTK